MSCTPTQEANDKISKNQPNTIQQNLTGTWTMYKEICCGRLNKERTGNDMQMPKKLEFLKDNEVIVLDLKTNKSKRLAYELTTKENENKVSVSYITFTNKPKGIFKLENNELIIDYGYMDLQKEFYRKN